MASFDRNIPPEGRERLPLRSIPEAMKGEFVKAPKSHQAAENWSDEDEQWCQEMENLANDPGINKASHQIKRHEIKEIAKQDEAWVDEMVALSDRSVKKGESHD